MTIRIVPDTYATINLAYNAAVAGDTIYIKESGSPYNEWLYPAKSNLLFQGESTNVVWYYGGGFNNIIINASGIELDSLHMQAYRKDPVFIKYGRNNINIHDCKLSLTGPGPSLIAMQNLVGVTINNNSFLGIHPTAIKAAASSSSRTITITNNTFPGVSKSSAIYCLVGANGSPLFIENNHITTLGNSSYEAYGIVVDGLRAATGSLIKDNTIEGVCYGTSKGAGRAISIGADNLEITGNKCTGCFQKYTIHLAAGAIDNVIHFNDFVGGKLGNAYNTDSNNTWNKNSIGNYYGYGGVAYDADGDGIGDDPYIIPVGSQDNYPLMCSIDIWPSCPYLAARKKWALGRVGVRFVRM